jgi:hypothetical protein
MSFTVWPAKLGKGYIRWTPIGMTVIAAIGKKMIGWKTFTLSKNPVLRVWSEMSVANTVLLWPLSSRTWFPSFANRGRSDGGLVF